MDLYIGKSARPAATVFDLAGRDEDDLTRSLAWALTRCEDFCDLVTQAVDLPFSVGAYRHVRVQHAIETRGRTDIELLGEKALVIFEAKLGWNLPGHDQVRLYEERIVEMLERSAAGCVEEPVEHGALVTLSESSAEWAAKKLPRACRSVPRRHLSWDRVIALAETAAITASLHDRRLLRDLINYLRSTTLMRDDPSSQMTWIVPVTAETPHASRRNFRETVQDGWYYNKVRKVPKVPFNFIAFRWEAALREIRFVKARRLFNDPHEALPDLFADPSWWEDHELFELGPPIHPPAPLPYGKLYAPGYHRALLDCLLTASSVAEARDWSQQRFASVGLSF